jgi:hypothetical protein
MMVSSNVIDFVRLTFKDCRKAYYQKIHFKYFDKRRAKPQTKEEQHKLAIEEYDKKLKEFLEAGGLKSNKPIPVKPPKFENNGLSVIEERKEDSSSSSDSSESSSEWNVNPPMAVLPQKEQTSKMKVAPSG